MEKKKVDMFMMNYSSYFPQEALIEVQHALENLPEEKEMYIHYAQMHDPNTALILSIVGLLGIAGLDRFFLGDIGLGILKLITCGACYIWTIIDLINVTNNTRRDNYTKLMTVLTK